MSRPNPTHRECWRCGKPPASQDRDLCAEHEHDCPSCAQVLFHIEEDGDTAGVALMLSLAAKQRQLEEIGHKLRAMQSEVFDLRKRLADSKPRIEVNGAANIMMHIDTHPVPDAAYIREQAELLVAYLTKIANGERPWWHEVKAGHAKV